MPRVSDAMAKDVLFVGTDDTLREVADRMRDRNVGSAVVDVPDRAAPGIITERDIVAALAASEDAAEAKVDGNFTADVTTAGTDWSLEDAARSMLRRGFRHLVVLDDEGQICGVVSMRDVVRGIVGEGGEAEKVPSEPDE
jgi:CBS domain-containing protein